MKYLSMRELRNQSSRLKSLLPQEHELVVTSNGKPIGFLVEASEDTLQDYLNDWRKIKAMRALAKVRSIARKKGTADMSMEAINKEISIVRKQKKNVC